jgi:hypothetical protein
MDYVTQIEYHCDDVCTMIDFKDDEKCSTDYLSIIAAFLKCVSQKYIVFVVPLIIYLHILWIFL